MHSDLRPLARMVEAAVTAMFSHSLAPCLAYTNYITAAHKCAHLSRHSKVFEFEEIEDSPLVCIMQGNVSLWLLVQ